jgi:copper transport protein
MLAGAVSIFSNSMVSHNTALSFFPSLAVSMDWFHFMAISMWVRGLFYISTILLMTIRLVISKDINIRRPINKSLKFEPVSINSYFLALLLPYFSLIATISLGIIIYIWLGFTFIQSRPFLQVHMEMFWQSNYY